MRMKLIATLILTTLIFAPAPAAHAAPHADVRQDTVTFNFPNTATFSAQLSSSAPITSVVLEYGSQQQTCGEVVAKAFPQFAPSTTASVQWTWDMRQSGSLPPGATIWWRWRFTDEAGNEQISTTQTATWLDSIHDWKTVSAENLRLHYYGRDEPFAQTMLAAGVEGLRRNKEQAGLSTKHAIDIYVYPNYNDMKEAVLYEPSWTGGQAYSDFNIVIMGVTEYDSSWNQDTVIHELTHVLVGQFTFSCIGTLPGWIEEGLAMFSEGSLDPSMQSMLERAIRSNTLITLRSLNGGFSELPDKANLSYAQSYSVIKFLIDTYGQEKMNQLLLSMSDAMPIDEALLQTYGFDTDGLEDAWRKSVGARPREVSAQPTAQPTPTYVPTYVPVSGAPLAVTPTPFVIPASTPRSRPPMLLTLGLFCACLLFLLIIGVAVLGFFLRKPAAKVG